MSTQIKLLPVALSGLLIATAAMGAGPRGAQNPTPVVTPLDDTEITELQFMREEEKLARDVYIQLDAEWGASSPVFANISEAEQSHMDAIQRMLEKYGVTDPVEDEDALGGFGNQDLAALYEQLLADGALSYVDALGVGFLIEETDIADLEVAIADTDNADLQRVYGNLLNGSYNHMRAFVAALQAVGETYDNQVLSDEEVAEILAGSNQAGGQGNGPANGGGRGGRF